MRITCDAKVRMGYVYLIPPKSHSLEDLDNSKVWNYFEPSEVKIPILNGHDEEEKLKCLEIMEKPYHEASEEDFTEEYCNDLDQQGYMKGIEMNFSKDRFLELIKHEAYKIYNLSWLEDDYILVTLDLNDEVFKGSNRIYPLTLKRDVFVIVSIIDKYQIGLIKGLISSRKDLYPIEYLSDPQFIIWE